MDLLSDLPILKYIILRCDARVYTLRMNINLKTTHYSITLETQSYLDERLAHIQKLLAGKSAQCDVELARETGHQHGDVWRAEINLCVEGNCYRADAKAENVNAAIDAVKDDIVRQLRKEKTRYLNAVRTAGAKVKEWLRFGGE